MTSRPLEVSQGDKMMLRTVYKYQIIISYIETKLQTCKFFTQISVSSIKFRVMISQSNLVPSKLSMWLHSCPLPRMGKISCSVFPVIFVLQTPIFHRTVPLLASAARNSVCTTRSQLLLKLIYSCSILLIRNVAHSSIAEPSKENSYS
jgi:hypothetical protein